MSDLSAINAQLQLIKARLIRNPVLIRGTGVLVDDPAFVEETQELNQLRQSLGILIRELRNDQHLLSARENALWKVPRTQRYPQSSSIAQQQVGLQRLLLTSAEIQKLLEDLMRKSGLLSSGELACGIGEMISKLCEQAHHAEVAMPGHRVYKPLTTGQFNASPEAAAIAVWMALHAWASVTKKRGKR